MTFQHHHHHKIYQRQFVFNHFVNRAACKNSWPKNNFSEIAKKEGLEREREKVTPMVATIFAWQLFCNARLCILFH